MPRGKQMNAGGRYLINKKGVKTLIERTDAEPEKPTFEPLAEEIPLVETESEEVTNVIHE